MARKPQLLKLAPIENEPPATFAAKVTGHNLGNITYLVSKAAERGGYRFIFAARFLEDGALEAVVVPTLFGRPAEVKAGDWVFLSPGKDYLTHGDRHPVQSGLFRELV